MEKRIYTVANAHLDTSWLWYLEDTIREYIPETLHRNFALLDKFPEYIFNFEGSYRYELMEEYYPADFEKLKGYVAQGRWVPTGSCYENGDCNMPSPEALTRNILYGNGYFREKFDVESNDIFLPDCFGFGRALPSIAAHSKLKGFSTQKLSWGGAADLPFDVGRWQGNDGEEIWVALKTDAYNTQLLDARNHKVAAVNVDESARKYDLGRTMLYYGTGDRGFSPTEGSAAQAAKEQNENDKHEVKVINASPKMFFEDMEALPEEQKAKMPVWNDEFLLTAHGTGSYTSRAVSKRWNRRGELLADAAERSAVAAHALGLAEYPLDALDKAWKNLIAHQFHDDITGTSFQDCYKRNWNDYVLAMHTFSREYTAAGAAVAAQMDTSFSAGVPVIVSNPVQGAGLRNEAVVIELPKKLRGKYYRVYDADGNEAPSQLVTENGKRRVVFRASVPSCGWRAYVLRTADAPCLMDGGMSIDKTHIENANYRVSIDANGDIASVYDKRLHRELLSAPIRMAVLPDTHSVMWPSWEVIYDDMMAEPRGYAANPAITVLEDGPARCALRIDRTCGKSRFTQIISLDADSEFVRVDNETDWRSEASMLKAVFPLAAQNEKAAYDVGVGTAMRPTNTRRLYEVPAQRWADITDTDGSFGVSVFSDSRVGWDKPDRRTLRLTCVHTPLMNCRWECAQHVMDMGLNRYSFAICGHAGKPEEASAHADDFCQPMHTFMTDKHPGKLGSRYSLMSVDNPQVRVMGLKKAQKSDEIILRLVESAGKPQQVNVKFAMPVVSVLEVTGDEMPVADDIPFAGDTLSVPMKKNQIRSFAIRLAAADEMTAPEFAAVTLPMDTVAVTANDERAAGNLPGGLSLPAELLPECLYSGGVHYPMLRGGESAVRCAGQQFALPEGCDTVHLILTSMNGDKKLTFSAGDAKAEVTVQDCFEHVGAWDIIGLGETGYIKPNAPALTLTHTHNAEGDMIAKQFHLFHAAVPVQGAATLTLPEDGDVFVFAAVAETGAHWFTPADAHFDRLEKRPFDYELSAYAKKKLQPAWFEKLFDKFSDRGKAMHLKFAGMYLIEAKADLYWLVNMMITKLGLKRRVKAIEAEWKKY